MAYEKGDIVFNEHGQKFVFITESDGDYIVRPTMETDEYEPWEGHPITLRKIFASAPREMYDKTIESLDAKIQELTTQKRALEEELRKSKQDETERKKRIMVNSALERIDDFLAGKMTHLAIHHWTGWTISPLKEALEYKENGYDRKPCGVKLVTLFGKSDGNLAWGLSEYSSWQNHPDHIHPFFSLEDAQVFVKGIFEQKYQAWRNSSKEWSSALSAAQNAISLGFDIPEDVAATIRLNTVSNRAERVGDAKKKLQEAEDELTAAKNKTVQELMKGKK